jgi:hypothetical protein
MHVFSSVSHPNICLSRHHGYIQYTYSAPFRKFYICFGLFDITWWMQYTKIGKYKIYLHSLRNRAEKFVKVESPLGLFKFISYYLPYFKKNKYIFQYHYKKCLSWFIRIDRNYLFGSFEITSIRLYTSLPNPLSGIPGVSLSRYLSIDHRDKGLEWINCSLNITPSERCFALSCTGSIGAVKLYRPLFHLPLVVRVGNLEESHTYNSL